MAVFSHCCNYFLFRRNSINVSECIPAGTSVTIEVTAVKREQQATFSRRRGCWEFENGCKNVVAKRIYHRVTTSMSLRSR